MAKGFYGLVGGALLTDKPIKGITQELKPHIAKAYGGKYFIGESMNKEAAKRIAELLGLEWEER